MQHDEWHSVHHRAPQCLLAVGAAVLWFLGALDHGHSLAPQQIVPHNNSPGKAPLETGIAFITSMQSFLPLYSQQNCMPSHRLQEIGWSHFPEH